MNKNRLGLWSVLLGVSFMLIITSCKRYPDPPPVFEKYGDDNAPLQRKVLIISVDGVSGRALKEIAPPNINKLMDQGKYSFNVTPMPVSTDASGWVTMLTGVGFGKHQIADSSFTYIPPSGGTDIGDAENTSQPHYPVVFNYLIPIMPKYKIAAITPWKGLSDYLGILDNSIAVQDDEAVKDTTIALLQRMPTLGVVVVDLHDADVAGKNGLYSLADFDYRAAILKDDEYVGDIIHALKQRKTYDREDWLIMVTTNRGGSVDNPEPGFVVLSNPALHREEVQKHGFNTINFHGAGDDAVIATVPDDKGLYNFGSSEDFTVQMQVKFNQVTSWPGFFSKSTGLSGGTITGWILAESGNNLALFVGGSDNGGNGKLQKNAATYPMAGDQRWHTITATFKTSGGVRTASLYIDGEPDGTADVTSRGNFDSPAPLRIGKVKGDLNNAADFYAADIEIFNVALDAQTIKDNIALKDITQHPDYSHLIGYWPLDDGAGSVITNRAPNGYNMVLNGPYKWVALDDDVPVSILPDSSSEVSVIPALQDISANMFYWLGIQPDTEWGLQGNPWLENFEDEIYGL